MPGAAAAHTNVCSCANNRPPSTPIRPGYGRNAFLVHPTVYLIFFRVQIDQELSAWRVWDFVFLPHFIATHAASPSPLPELLCRRPNRTRPSPLRWSATHQFVFTQVLDFAPLFSSTLEIHSFALESHTSRPLHPHLPRHIVPNREAVAECSDSLGRSLPALEMPFAEKQVCQCAVLVLFSPPPTHTLS